MSVVALRERAEQRVELVLPADHGLVAIGLIPAAEKADDARHGEWSPPALHRHRRDRLGRHHRPSRGDDLVDGEDLAGGRARGEAGRHVDGIAHHVVGTTQRVSDVSDEHTPPAHTRSSREIARVAQRASKPR